MSLFTRVLLALTGEEMPIDPTLPGPGESAEDAPENSGNLMYTARIKTPLGDYGAKGSTWQLFRISVNEGYRRVKTAYDQRTVERIERSDEADVPEREEPEPR